MRNLIPNWLMAFALFYVILQIITIEYPEDPRGDEKPPRLLSEHLDTINNMYAADMTHKVSYEDNTKQESVVCLAKNAYFEARNQSVLSQIAVSQVVMNRVQHKDFPNTVCGVVYEAQLSKWYKEKLNKEVPLKDRCQFSWYCDGKADIIRDQDAYEIALAVAHQVLSGYDMVDVTKGALWYHATYVSPYWAKEKLYTVKHEDHIFYTERN